MSVVTISRPRPLLTVSTVDPTMTDYGYKLGTVWLNSVAGRTFRCIDNTIAAAVWKIDGFETKQAAASLTAPACVALDSAGKLIYANAGSKSTAGVVGFIPASISINEYGLVQTLGLYTFVGASYSSANFGKPGYLSLTNGLVSETQPAFGTGRAIKPVCIITGASEILINIQVGGFY